jgi:hypothetical protein
MRKLLLSCACASALLVAATTAPAAFAERPLPEFGRCVKVAAGSTGAYTGTTCVTLATTRPGHYEWMPLTSEEKDTLSGAGAEVVLASAGRLPIKCVVANVSGTYTGPKTANVKIEFQGCVNGEGKQCTGITTPQSKSEIETLPLEAELGYTRDEEVNGHRVVQVGLDLKPTSPLTELATYECGNVLETFSLAGSVIGALRPIDRMNSTTLLRYRVAQGAQVPQSFVGAAPDTLSTKISSGVPPTTQTVATTLAMKQEISLSNSTPVEIKALEK